MPSKRTEDYMSDVLFELWEIWKTRPELRLAQLLENYHAQVSDPYNMEDVKFLEALKRFYKLDV